MSEPSLPEKTIYPLTDGQNLIQWFGFRARFYGTVVTQTGRSVAVLSSDGGHIYFDLPAGLKMTPGKKALFYVSMENGIPMVIERAKYLDDNFDLARAQERIQQLYEELYSD